MEAYKQKGKQKTTSRNRTLLLYSESVVCDWKVKRRDLSVRHIPHSGLFSLSLTF